MPGTFFIVTLLYSCLAENIVVTPDAEVATKVQQEATNTKIRPFKQLTQGSTPAGWMQLGTPPKWLKVIFDTGSDKLVAKTWETISQELLEVDQGLDGLIMPTELLYNHNSSSTYFATMGRDPFTGEVGHMKSLISYGSGQAETAEGKEKVTVGTYPLRNFSISEIVQDDLSLLHTAKGISGILGLQHMMNKSMGESLFSKMRDAKQMTSFGYCRGLNNTGTFIWGDDSKEGFEIPIIGQMHWAVTLNDVKVHHGGAASDHNTPSPVLAEKSSKPSHHARVAVRTRKQHQQKRRVQSHGGKEVQGSRRAFPFDDPAGNGDFPAEVGGESGDGGSGMDGRAPPDSPGEGGRADAGNEPFDIQGDGDGAGDGADGDDGGADGDGDAGDPFGDAFGGEKSNPKEDIERAKKHMCTMWNCTAVLDTGSNIIAGPTDAVKGMVAQINVKNDCSNFDELPPLTFKLGGKEVTVHAESYVMKVEIPPGMAGILGGDGDGDYGDAGDGDAGDGDGDDGDADQSGDSDGGGCGGGGCGGGGCGGGGCALERDRGSKDRVGVAMPEPHGINIGVHGKAGGPSVSISINRHDPEKHAPEGNVRKSLLHEPVGLEQQAIKRTKHHVSATTARWRKALAHMKKHRGIDLTTALGNMVTHEDGSDAQYLCMPALVPLDKFTPFGALWIVGTPFLDEYYGRYSFDHGASAPKFNFMSLKDSKTCKNLTHDQSTPLQHNSTSGSQLLSGASSSASAGHSAPKLMRSEQTATPKAEQHSHQQQAKRTRGPVIRKLDEIMYPHWANSLIKL